MKPTWSIPIAVCLLLSGCAGVTVQALSPDGNKYSGAEGLRYYMPRPYLLVTAVPVDGPQTQQIPPAASTLGMSGAEPAGATETRNVTSGFPPPGSPGRIAGHAARGGSSGKAGGDPSKDAKSDDSASKGDSAPSSDTAYQQTGGGYQIKLVYLPDLSRPMTITFKSGLFGSVSAQPTLADGWMLTSLQSSADNKVAETLASVASIISAKNGTGTQTKAGGAGGGPGSNAPSSMPLLVPGLYAFDYDRSSGVLADICAVKYFVDKSSLPSDSIKECKNRATSWTDEYRSYSSPPAPNN